jgi:hypothetical protein
MAWQIVFTAGASLVAAALFLMLGVALWNRSYDADVQGAGRSFASWWLMVALASSTDAARTLLALLDPIPVGPYLALARLKMLAVAAAYWGLAYYVYFLWSGRQRYGGVLAALALLHAAVFLGLLQRQLPAVVHYESGWWAPRLQLLGPSIDSPVFAVPGSLLFFLPILVLALAYLLLLRRMPDLTTRFRVAAVTGVLILYFLVASLQYNPAFPSNTLRYPILSLLSLGAAVVAWVAYRPFAWMVRRYNLRSLRDEPHDARRP